MSLLKKELNLLSSALIIFSFGLLMTIIIVRFSWQVSCEMEEMQNQRLEVLELK